MSSKDEMLVAQKAMVNDVRCALKKLKGKKETYTAEEIIDLLDAIIDAKEQAP